MKDVHFDYFEMQSLMKSSKLNLDEIILLFALRSKSYPAKMNYKKMNKGYLKCTFLCDSEKKLMIDDNLAGGLARTHVDT